MAKEYHSKYRSWIENWFAGHTDSRVSAHDLHAYMQEDGMKVNLVTVYRNLDKLTDEKLISCQKMPGEDENYYRYMQPKLVCTEHLHLYCKECGRVVHLNCHFMNEISRHLMADHGFSVDCRDSMIVGLCRDCREKRETENGRDAYRRTEGCDN